jgi:hypothetical protein
VSVRMRCLGEETREVKINWGKEGGEEKGDWRGANTRRTWGAWLEGRREEYSDFGDAVEMQRGLQRIQRTAMA